MSSTPRTLDELRAFFRQAPFMVDLGVEPVAVAPGRVSTRLVLQAHQAPGLQLLQTHADVAAAEAQRRGDVVGVDGRG